MNKIEKPEDNVRKVFSDCISNFRDEIFKNKLINSIDDIVTYTIDYEEKMLDKNIHNMTVHDELNDLSKDDLLKVYKDKMAKKGQPGRKYYDKYMSIPEYDICPYCGQRVVSTLDHYLPKSKYISLVVTPTNLIPACQDCNKAKSDKSIENLDEATINPYFDDLGKDIWLTGEIIKSNDFIMTYKVSKPINWSQELYKRVKNHFKLFNLNKLYSSHAAQELVMVKRKMLRLYNNIGPEAVMKDLKENIDAYSYRLNSWQVAMYRELLNDSWFINDWLPNKGN